HGLLTENARRNGIVEHERPVEHLVRRAQQRRALRGPAWLASREGAFVERQQGRGLLQRRRTVPLVCADRPRDPCRRRLAVTWGLGGEVRLRLQSDWREAVPYRSRASR